MSDEIIRALGRIEGQLEGIKAQQIEQGTTLREVDKRLRKVETKAAVNGAVSGGIMATGVSILVTGIREAFRSNGVG